MSLVSRETFRRKSTGKGIALTVHAGKEKSGRTSCSSRLARGGLCPRQIKGMIPEERAAFLSCGSQFPSFSCDPPESQRGPKGSFMFCKTDMRHGLEKVYITPNYVWWTT